MITLLLRAVTLEGALKGILFFLTPQWHELSNPKVIFEYLLGNCVSVYFGDESVFVCMCFIIIITVLESKNKLRQPFCILC